MKRHLLTLVIVGLGGVTMSNAADYGYGGPWSPPGYGTPWDNGQGSSYGQNQQLPPWGGAPYDAMSSSQQSYPSNPWNRGNGADYPNPRHYRVGPSGGHYEGREGHYGGRGYRAPGYESRQDSYYGGNRGRTPDYYWGGAGFEAEPNYGQNYNRYSNPNPWNSKSYSRYGSSSEDRGDMERGYDSNYNNHNIGGNYGEQVAPSSRYGWNSGRGYGSPSTSADSQSRDGWGSMQGVSPSYPGEKSNHRENNYSNMNSSPPNGGSNSPAFSSDAGKEQGNTFHSDSNVTSDGNKYSSWGFTEESGNGLIPSPAGGSPADIPEKDSGKSGGEIEAK